MNAPHMCDCSLCLVELKSDEPDPQLFFNSATNRLRIALTSGQAERYEPGLLMAQLINDLGFTVPIEWWNTK